MPDKSVNQIPAAIRAALVQADVDAGRRTKQTAQRYYQRLGTVTGTQRRGIGAVGLARLKELTRSIEYAEASKTVYKQQAGRKRAKAGARKYVPEMTYIEDMKRDPATSDKVPFLKERDYDDTTGVLVHHGQYYLDDKMSRGKAREEAVALAESYFSGEEYER